MYALAFTITCFLSILSDVFRLPREVATTSDFPDFDFLAGTITGRATTSIPFLNLAFIFVSSYFVSHPKQVGSAQQAIPELLGAKTSNNGWTP
jgi:hypothetical protein